MFGLLNLATNTITGAAQVVVGTVKVGVGALVSPIDDGDTLNDAMGNVKEGMKKIGSTK